VQGTNLFKNSSILFKINLVFTIASLVIIFATAYSQIFVLKRDRAEVFHKAKESFSKETRYSISKREVSEPELSNILRDGERFDLKDSFEFVKKRHENESSEHIFRERDEFEERNDFERGFGKPPFNSPNRENMERFKRPHHKDDYMMVLFEERIYIYFSGDSKLLKSDIFYSRDFSPSYIGTLFLTLMLFLYFLVWKSFKPLKDLEILIRKFGDGELEQINEINSNDEVGRIWREFNKAVSKIDSLEKSRELFLRNIIHELKTPITKGKLVIAIQGENRETQILNSVFNRLDSLINEMANIEKLISKSGDQNSFCKLKFSSILNEAIKIGFIDQNRVSMRNDNETFGDLALLSIAFKNLIDNGIKYSNDKKVYIRVFEKSLIFVSNGDRLKKDFDDYLKPFSHSQITSGKGFGLGLYITNEVANRHNFKFKYRNFCGKNIFILKINTNALTN
jgi:two-component system OmpR family sensor kinase